ncbi:MAG: Ig-like domain-containing protein [Panacagrimonas sp.]
MRQPLRLAFLCLSALALASCGGGSSSDQAAPSSPPNKVQGAVVKGPLQNAQVQLFALDDAGLARGEPQATLTTDDDGRFTFERAADAPALLAVTRGGSFVDESDPALNPADRRRITLTQDQGFEAVLPAGATSLVITPYTNARLLQVRRAAAGADFLAFLASSSEQSVLAFGFDPAVVIPEPPLAPAPGASTAAKRYAMLIGGAAFAIQAQSLALDTVPTFATVRAFIDDLSDGRINGQVNNTAVRVRVGERILSLPTSVDLNSEVRRFANNNFALYADIPLASVDEDALSVVPTPGNLRPVASDDAYATLPDTPLSVAAPGVLDNDSDPDGDTLGTVLAAGPANGTLALAPNGSFVYTPAVGFIGNDSFTYNASDGVAQSNLATVSIRVDISGTEPPVTVADRFSTAEDAPLTVGAPGVLANDLNQGVGTLRAIRVEATSNGTLALAPDGGLIYVPAANFNGADSFTYLASNDNGQSSPVTVSIVVDPVNDAPVAVADSFTTTEDTPLQIAARGVLANDSDVDGNALTAIVETPPAHGTLELAADGSFLYTPEAEFGGSDSFTYRASDGSAQSAPATVNIIVGISDDLPVAADDAFATDEDLVLTIAAPGVLANDTDPEGARLRAVLVAGPQNGTLQLAVNGAFRYTPAADFSGTDSFTYQATDGTAQSAVATVMLTVRGIDDAPVAAPDSYSTPEDQVLTVATPGVLGNDLDADGSALTAVLVTGPANGTLALAANGSFTYTPAVDFTGLDGFSYSARDAATSSAPVAVTISVGPVGDPPIAANDAFTVAEGALLTIAPAGVLANDRDPEGTALTAVLVSGPENGNLSLDANGGFTYTHDGSETTTDSFTYRASDGLAQSASATVSLTVTPVNDVPVAGADSFSTREDSPLTVAAPGVLGNDSDAEGTALTAVMFGTVPAAQGVLVTNANGGFSFTPAANFNGTVRFSYRASDGSANSDSATVTINVGPANDLPIAAGESFITAEDTPLTVAAPGVLSNDSDADDDPLTAMLVSAPASGTLSLGAGGGFTYTPAANFSGMTSFTYRASDGTANSSVATVTLTVTAEDDPPLAIADSFEGTEGQALSVTQPGVLGNDSDADGDPLTATLITPPASGTLSLNPNGSFVYTPAANFSGNVSFTYRASDGSAPLSNLATVTLAIAEVNAPPMAANNSYNATEDMVLTVAAAQGVLVNDSDPDDDPLTAVMYSAVSPAQGMLAGMSNGGFSFTPADDFNGPVTFTYRASDGSQTLSNVATVTINVGAVNDPPVAAADSYTTGEDTPLVRTMATGVLANDTDPEDDTLTAVMFGNETNGQITSNPDGGFGGFTFTPAANFAGTASFTYRARDGSGSLSAPALVTITVTANDDPPVAVADPTFLTVAEGGTANTGTRSVLDNDDDPDGDTLTAQLVTGPSNNSGTFTLMPNGRFSYTHDGSQTTSDSFTYRASDGSGPLSNTVTVTIVVTPVDDPPVAVADPIFLTVDEGGTANTGTRSVLDNDDDPDGDTLTAQLVTGPSNHSGTFTLMPNGRFTYTHDGSQTTSDSFTYRASDGAGPPSNTVTVTIAVTLIDSPPVAVDDIRNTTEDTPLIISTAALSVLENDSDPDNDPITAVLLDDVDDGTLSLNPDGTFTYTPDADFEGVDTFTYQVSDGSPPLSGVATVTLNVAAVNDAPVALDDGFSTPLDTELVINLPGVLTNDNAANVDAGETLTAVLDVDVSQGSLAFNPDGSFTFTPAFGVGDDVSFTYHANDGSLDSDPATVTITVGAIGPGFVASAEQASAVTRFPLAKLQGSPKRGAILLGADANDASGRSVRTLGDVNSDGIDDFAVVAQTAAGTRRQTYIVFGNGGGLPSPLDLGTLDGGNGYALGSKALSADVAGSGGDFNGDGFEDRIVLDAPGRSGSMAHVVFGASDGLRSDAPVDPAALDGSNGFRISTGTDNEGLEPGMAGAGDFDNDGISDLLVSMPLADTRSGGSDSGAVYLIFGHRQLGAGGTLLPSVPADGRRVIRFEGARAGDMAGVGIGAAGDVNNDGIDDLLIGAPGAARSADIEDAGRTYLIYGRERR